MKSFVCVVLGLAVFHLSAAQDDGKYRPHLYGGDDGSYRHTNDGHYSQANDGSSFQRNGKYNSIFAGVQPVVQVQPAYNPFGQVSAFGQNIYQPDPYAAFATASKPVVAAARFSYAQDARNAQILRQDQDLDLNAYHYLYQTENGINAEETGRIDPSPSNGGTRANGYYEYTGDDGVKYRVDYVADQNGFQPRGAHLPKSE